MHVSTRSAFGGLSRVAILGFYALVVVGLAAALAFEKTSLAYQLVALIVLPAFCYVALRWPMIFPFGAYALSVPLDPLLKNASGAGGTLTRVIGILTIACALLYAYRVRRLNVPPSSWYFWGAYLVWALAGWAWSYDAPSTKITISIISSLFALYTVAAVFPITPLTYVFARRGVVFAGVVTALYGFYGFATGQRLGTRLALESGSLQVDPNHYAAFFSIPIAILFARFFITNSGRERLITLGLATPMVINVLLTGSRGGLFAIAAVALYLGIRSRRFALLGGLLIGGLALSAFLPEFWLRLFDPNLQDGSGRGDIWNTGITAMLSHGLFGTGIGTFPTVYTDTVHLSHQANYAGPYRPAHDILIQTIVELGIPGLIILLAAWWTSTVQNNFIARTSIFFADRIGYEAAMIGIFISALTIDLVAFKYLWLCLMMIVFLANAVRPRILLGTSAVDRQANASSMRRVRTAP